MFDASHQRSAVGLSLSLIFWDSAMTGCHDACMECSVRVLPIMSLEESAWAFFRSSFSHNYMAYRANTHTDTNETMDNMLPWPAGLPFPMQQMIWCFRRVCLTSAWCSMQVTVAPCISLSALSHKALLLLILRVMDLIKPLTPNIKLWHVTCLALFVLRTWKMP